MKNASQNLLTLLVVLALLLSTAKICRTRKSSMSLKDDFLKLKENIPEPIREMGKKFGVDIADYYGNDSGEMPLAATYVINRGGIIVHAFLDSDYTNRMEQEEIIQVLKKMT